MVKDFKSARYLVQWMILMMIYCGMALKRIGVLGVNVRKMKALTVQMEKMTLIGKRR
jgi:uncharacterized membrane protein (Fun14 family)